MFVGEAWSDFPGQRKMAWPRIGIRELPNLASSINHTFCGARDRLVPFRQKFGQNRKILHWMLRGFRVGLNIDNVDRRMPGQILLELDPGAGQDPAASIETRDRSAEDITREGKCCDVTRGYPDLCRHRARGYTHQGGVSLIAM